MERLKTLIRGEPKVQKKFIRDTKGRPYYLTSLSFYKKYPRLVVFGGGTLAFLITYSGFFYNLIFTDPSTVNPADMLWRSEIQSGVTKLERFRQAFAKPPPEQSS